jgi:hypothetical protein
MEFDYDRYRVDQLVRPIANMYRVTPLAIGETPAGPPVAYVRQKKMKIKEDIRFRLSPDVDDHLFMIKSKSVWEFRGRHQVLDAEGAELGLLEKNFTRSLLRSHWHVRDPEGNELLESHESSWIIAILRRIADILPDWFGLLGWLPFNFVVRRNGEEVGHYRRVLGKFRDRYVFEIRPGLKDVDHRLLVAFAVGLDALQDR